MDEIIPNPPPSEAQPTAAPRRGPWDWLKDDPNFPSAKRLTPRRRTPAIRQFLYRWFRPSLFLSTWLILLLAGAALLLLEIPGRRTGFTTYAHGWPFAYMRRDYRQDQDFLDEDRWTMHGWLDGIGGKHWIDTDPAAVDAYQEVFARDGFPLVYEQQMSPWSATDVTMFSEFALAADIVLTILLLIAISRAAQRWRRRRFAAGRRWTFQFRLRTLLVAVAILGPIMGFDTSVVSGLPKRSAGRG